MFTCHCPFLPTFWLSCYWDNFGSKYEYLSYVVCISDHHPPYHQFRDSKMLEYLAYFASNHFLKWAEVSILLQEQPKGYITKVKIWPLWALMHQPWILYCKVLSNIVTSSKSVLLVQYFRIVLYEYYPCVTIKGCGHTCLLHYLGQ